MAKEKFNFIQPLKDIPQALKGFPKNLVHIWKDPVQNSEEIKVRRGEILAYLYLFVGLFLLFAALSAFIQPAQDILMIVAIIPGFGIAAAVFLLLVLKKAQQKFADLECTNCKARIKYDKTVQITPLSRQFTVSREKQVMSGHKPVTKDTPVVVLERTPMYVKVTGKEFTKVSITCKCQACGTEKTFEHEFVTAECERFENRIMAVNADTYVLKFEEDVRAEGNEGFDGKSGTTARGVKINYHRSLDSLVAGYFGNEIQMR